MTEFFTVIPKPSATRKERANMPSETGLVVVVVATCDFPTRGLHSREPARQSAHLRQEVCIHACLWTARRLSLRITLCESHAYIGWWPLGTSHTPDRESIPVTEYIQGAFVPLSHLAHDWEFHSAIPLTPAEERTMVREPAQAVPAAIAERLAKVRVLLVPYVACFESGDMVSFSKPEGETHSAVWVETSERINLVLACRELDPHDTGFEFLGSIAESLRAKLSSQETDRYAQLLEDELQRGVRGEIDEEALAAKQALLRGRAWRRSYAQLERYREISRISTVAEYMHGLWHDVQIRVGPEHLPVPELRRRMTLLAEMFPPNPGYRVFAQDLEEKLEGQE